MSYILDKNGMTRCSLDSSSLDAFSQKEFSDLINEAHARGHDYYLARVHCKNKKDAPNNMGTGSYVCYDAKQLCKNIFEMVISAEGRKIRIKSFSDPVSGNEIKEINFFKLRYDSETPLRAEFVGNHSTFLESHGFRSKMFYYEDPMEALGVNFQFKQAEKLPYIKKKNLMDVILVVVMIILICMVAYIGVRMGKKEKNSITKDIEITNGAKHSLVD